MLERISCFGLVSTREMARRGQKEYALSTFIARHSVKDINDRKILRRRRKRSGDYVKTYFAVSDLERVYLKRVWLSSVHNWVFYHPHKKFEVAVVRKDESVTYKDKFLVFSNCGRHFHHDFEGQNAVTRLLQ